MSETPRRLSNSIMKLRGEVMAEKIELQMPPILGLDNDYSYIEEIYNQIRLVFF